MRQLRYAMIILLIFTVQLPPVTPNYVEAGECKGPEHCHYSYTAYQEFFNDDEKEDMKIRALLNITCTSSGIHNDTLAKLFCMDIKNATISGSLVQDITEAQLSEMEQSITNLFSNWFCFVQNSHGKVVAVYHSPSDNDQAVMFKKGIAAAFQANFRGTNEEEETDPGSSHTSHYTDIPTGEKGKLKMRRTVHGNDVHEYASHAPKKDMDMAKDEEVEYASGHLVHSSGNTTMWMVGESANAEDDISLSNALLASGSFDLKLLYCHNATWHVFRAQKSVLDANIRSCTEEGLIVNVDKSVDERNRALQEMKLLRKKFPSGSISGSLRKCKEDKETDKLVGKLQKLIRLESQYGVLPVLPPYTPAINEVLAFVDNVSNSTKVVAEAVFMLLSADGSLQSQLALLKALDNANSTSKAHTILLYIAFLDSASLDLIINLENRLHESTLLSSQLLLVYGSLALKGTKEIELRIINYLSALCKNISNQSDPDLSKSILLVHALGNTGSNSSLALILSFLNYSVKHRESKEMKLAVIDALSKLTDNTNVLNKLEEFLVTEESESEEYFTAVLETLFNGFDYIEASKSQMEAYIGHIQAHSILVSIIRAAASINSTDLHNMMVQYFRKVGAKDLFLELVGSQSAALNVRAKRHSSDWDSTLNSDYNIVAPLASRRSDIYSFSRHNAYITSKRIGVSDAHIKVASGYFVGINENCDRMKSFARNIIKGTVLSRHTTVGDIRFEQTTELTSTTNTFASLYIRIGSNVLFDSEIQFNEELSSHCKNESRHLFLLRVRLVSFSYRMFIYVGFLDFSIGLYGKATLNFNINVCNGRIETEISGHLGALTPSVTVSIDGSVTASLVELIRGGVTASASFGYQIEPIASVQACKNNCSLHAKLCVEVHDSWPDNTLELYAFYQFRTFSCPHFDFTCDGWGKKHRWNGLDHTWHGPSSPRKCLWSSCKGKLHPTCGAGALLMHRATECAPDDFPVVAVAVSAAGLFISICIIIVGCVGCIICWKYG